MSSSIQRPSISKRSVRRHHDAMLHVAIGHLVMDEPFNFGCGSQEVGEDLDHCFTTKHLVMGTLSYSQSSDTISIAAVKWLCSMFSINRVTYSPGSVILSVAVAIRLVWQAQQEQSVMSALRIQCTNDGWFTKRCAMRDCELR